jgi:hypothetical protein
MKRVGIYVAIYYALGLILMNLFTILRFLGSADISEISLMIIKQNMLSASFYGLTAIWPVYLGLNIYNFATGNIG